jgi:taurine---2-oxoglutarate transaminase
MPLDLSIGKAMTERDAVMHSWCVQNEWDAPTVVGGSGAWFWDDQGRRYLDMSSQAECCNLGHQHPRVVAAIRDQAERLCYIANAWGAQPRAELAQRLLERAGFAGGRVFFTLGGADANEHAVKFARWATDRPLGKIITRYRSYHGASSAAFTLSADARGQHQPPGLQHVLHALPPYCYRCPFGQTYPACALRCAEHVGELIDWEGRDTVAAVLMEPHAGTNGIVAPDDYWPRLREICEARDVLLIADEVMSGFGRVGNWFAWQRHGEAGRPDLMTLAKGLTGAHLPLGAVLVSPRVCERLDGRMLAAGLTYCGHPLSCAAGVAALTAYEAEGLVQRSRDLGTTLRRRLDALSERHPCIGDVRGDGLFQVLELVADRADRKPLAPWSGSGDTAVKRLVRMAQARGVCFAARGNLLILAPPLVIAEGDLDLALDMLDDLLAECDAAMSA